MLLVVLLSAAGARAADPDYRELALHAGIIFRGTVEAVERVPAVAPDEISTVRITFRVQEGVRGASSGQLLTLRQWDGPSATSYRAGEAVVLFLYPPSGELGLTSTVGEHLGRVPIEDAEAALAAARAAQSDSQAEPAPASPSQSEPPSSRTRQPETPTVRPERRHPAGSHGSILPPPGRTLRAD